MILIPTSNEGKLKYIIEQRRKQLERGYLDDRTPKQLRKLNRKSKSHFRK